jgi:lipid-binding SYLF domain-containing protein
MKYLIAAVVSLTMVAVGSPGRADTAYAVASGSNQALQQLYRTSPVAALLGRRAKAILVFPRINKASLVVGGASGEGELMRGRSIDGYYKLETQSFGIQVGAESNSYVVFLMTASAVANLERGSGWQLGHGPTLMLVGRDAPRNLATAPLRYDSYGFAFNQRGLIAGVGAEGTRISRTTLTTTTTAAASTTRGVHAAAIGAVAAAPLVTRRAALSTTHRYVAHAPARHAAASVRATRRGVTIRTHGFSFGFSN